MSTIEKRGVFTVLRDSKGKLVERIVSPTGPGQRETFRAFLRKKTNGGFEPYEILLSIARGEPFIAKLDGGRESEPQIPSIESRRQAAKDLAEFIHGKAVAQTEVMKAEEEAQQMEQIRALSDEELRQRVTRVLEMRKEEHTLPASESTIDAESQSALDNGGEGE